MHRIIRQNSALPALPDFRNLGTILRILVAANVAALAVVVAREPRLEGLASGWTAMAGAVEPHVLTELALLWIVQPLFARLTHAQGIALITAFTVGVGFATHQLVAGFTPMGDGSLLRYLLFALSLQLLLVFYFRLRAKALSPAITEARLQALQARIRPHFLFNSINAVLSLIRREPERAEEALEDMADLFRVLMRENRDLQPLAKEVELCRQYLELEQLRLGERLIVDWNVKSMPADALVPPLVLQPLLENAVYHGIEPSSSPGTLSINIFMSRDEVHALLRNPFVPNERRHHAGNKMALANVRERLALHFDAEASLESKTTKDFYEVHIRMPYRKSKPEGAAQAPAAGSRPEPAARRGPAQERSRVPLRAFPAIPDPEAVHG